MSEERYFFALWPDETVRYRLSTLAHTSEPGEGRRHNAKDLHMTLVFLGQIAPSQKRCIEDVADGIRGAPIELSIDRTGYWSRPRIFWASPGETPPALSQLVVDLNNGLTGCGHEPEERSYKPHVTLYRKARRVVPQQLAEPIVWQVNEFVLASSANPGSSGTRYQVLRRWALG
ncbi:MAG: RNA 2',3'-cyclic phosphodiesterase [Candidatus Thiodiazotropha sp. (ex Lucina aurantia)]|uniref:RNA 2',3'-cyclic phosphodiesterase n=1 Tax=Candidatus Thiodiazotropha endolucinida TaxID=1655433 RepID=A0A7Z0VLX9_9GAMM|nr:RNA 2',3'-cyclic phosphodiesterase [Candidatus Thiodiazotropha endolucinida]MBT3013701.1 RNA 2',3'-cyclic phosphodiesterase [Candidatus Thiodiazotropha sp. (ex Lucina pensylvanica)]MBT3025140.1 RNA 2',3'-cyclic phosphodiesterase [Candidatus Thiodiazotropha taylori]MBT3039327.1 RNA 2',3'-cyclic phosphodiesterase [Candidatus Thiodiazotropha sp. (ex Codakia orbicularis)]MBV2104916.1 RNA 2',3'-cyclic phosphodiesterase [Candidatus Thiodiazotropha sp. (ex Lucina aurantia)]MBT3032909.1 RNA 2',3'-c